MPPTGKLEPTQVAVLTRWVEMGAAWPASARRRRRPRSRPEATEALRRGSRLLVASIRSAGRARQAGRRRADGSDWAREPDRPVRPRRLLAAGLTPAPEADRGDPDPPGLRSTYRPAADARGDRRLPRPTTSPDAYERLVDRLLASPPLRRALGAALARPGPLRRVATATGPTPTARRLALPRLRRPLVQRRQALRPLRHRATGRRRARPRRSRAAGRHRLPAARDLRVQPAQRPRAVGRHPQRHHRRDRRRLPRPGHRLRPVPRPQVRPDPPEGLLPAPGVLRADPAPRRPAAGLARRGRRVSGASWPPGRRRPPRSARRSTRSRGRYRAEGGAGRDRQVPRGHPGDAHASPRAERTPLEQQLAALAYRQVDLECDKLETAHEGPRRASAGRPCSRSWPTFDAIKPEPCPAVLTVDRRRPRPPPPTISRRSRRGADRARLPVGCSTPRRPRSTAPAARRTRPDAALALARWLTRPDNPLTHAGDRQPGLAVPLRPGDRRRPPATSAGWASAPTPSRAARLAGAPVRRGGLAAQAAAPADRDLRAYRQSAERPESETESARRIDPENRLLWRWTVQRLDAEQIRDAMLAVSGELDPRSAAGPSVDADGAGGSIYTKVMRNSHDPMLEAFDAPDGFVSTPAAERDHDPDAGAPADQRRLDARPGPGLRRTAGPPDADATGDRDGSPRLPPGLRPAPADERRAPASSWPTGLRVPATGRRSAGRLATVAARPSVDFCQSC